MIFELVENIRKPYPPQRDKTKVLSLKVKVEISKLICLLFSHTPVGRWPGEFLDGGGDSKCSSGAGARLGCTADALT